MANTPTTVSTAAVGTTLTTVYTCPSSAQYAIVIGLSIAQSGANSASIAVNVKKSRGGTVVFLENAAPVPVGGSLVVVGGDQKVILKPNDFIQVQTSTSTVDVDVSVVENY
jgi:hypothetical protein